MADGTFIVSYESVSAALGAYQLGVNLVVDIAHNTAAGVATVTNGSIKDFGTVKLPVSGTVTAMTVMGPVTHFLIALESPNMPGRHMDVRLVTQQDWQSGTANVSLWLDTPQGVVQFTTQVKAVQAKQVSAA
jgi:hypothetical protein